MAAAQAPPPQPTVTSVVAEALREPLPAEREAEGNIIVLLFPEGEFKEVPKGTTAANIIQEKVGSNPPVADRGDAQANVSSYGSSWGSTNSGLATTGLVQGSWQPRLAGCPHSLMLQCAGHLQAGRADASWGPGGEREQPPGAGGHAAQEWRLCDQESRLVADLIETCGCQSSRLFSCRSEDAEPPPRIVDTIHGWQMRCSDPQYCPLR